MKGMVDTGNFLSDPLTGKPVMVISASAAKRFLPEDIVDEAVKEKNTQILSEVLMNSDYATRIRMIPYQSIGEERGYLVGIRPDMVRIGVHDRMGSDRTVTASEGAILAIYKGMFSGGQSEEGCSILLHPSMIEGGIACDV
jgi:stage II sporulation protein GA (sporulation sigma-E factor processing peptidase)